MRQLQWQQVTRGVWKTTVGEEKGVLDLLSQSGVAPKLAALEAMSAVDFPFAEGQVSVSKANDNVLLSLPLEPKEKLYGLGLNFKQLEVQQTIRHLHVDHFGGKDNGRGHAPVPFYVSNRGYGVFINLARYISVYAGGTHRKENHPPVIDRQSSDWKAVQPSGMVEVAMPAPGAEILVFAGRSMLEVVRRFNLYCGGGCLPARHALGFWHRVPMKFSAEEAMHEADEFAARGFPLDVMGLEPGWHTQSYPTTYEWNRERFPRPDEFLAAMKTRGVHINLWENCYVAPQCELGKKLDSLSGSHTGGWGGLIPDFTLEEAREILAEQHRREHLAIGVGGYKLDECDGYDQWIWPDHATFPSGLSGEQLRQVYGVLFQRLTTEMFRRENKRTYGLVRASNAGAVSFPYVLYNDYYNHRDFITALCSSGFCGLLWTPEARSSATAEEWLRRIQSTCLSPLAMINAWADGTQPWSFPEVSEAVKAAMLLRMRLLPYLYTAFATYREDGTPPVCPMALVEDFFVEEEVSGQGELDSTANPYNLGEIRDIRDQYMLGPALLVAPVFAGETQRTVVFPPGKWFDFYSGDWVSDGAEERQWEASLEKIPLFVRDGGIIPMLPACLHVPTTEEGADLELRHYGSAPGSYALYDDDGESCDYEQGEFCWTSLEVVCDADGRLRGQVVPASEKTFLYREIAWKFMTEPGDE